MRLLTAESTEFSLRTHNNNNNNNNNSNNNGANGLGKGSDPHPS
jgi:hypothetical protein